MKPDSFGWYNATFFLPEKEGWYIVVRQDNGFLTEPYTQEIVWFGKKRRLWFRKKKHLQDMFFHCQEEVYYWRPCPLFPIELVPLPTFPD